MLQIRCHKRHVLTVHLDGVVLKGLHHLRLDLTLCEGGRFTPTSNGAVVDIGFTAPGAFVPGGAELSDCFAPTIQELEKMPLFIEVSHEHGWVVVLQNRVLTQLRRLIVNTEKDNLCLVFPVGQEDLVKELAKTAAPWIALVTMD